eukprot:Polyplicarium_translucidae@DN1381_c0_g1_i1.p4
MLHQNGGEWTEDFVRRVVAEHNQRVHRMMRTSPEEWWSRRDLPTVAVMDDLGAKARMKEDHDRRRCKPSPVEGEEVYVQVFDRKAGGDFFGGGTYALSVGSSAVDVVDEEGTVMKRSSSSRVPCEVRGSSGKDGDQLVQRRSSGL